MPTGQQSSMTFGTSGITLDVISIEPNEESVEDIALPHLGLDAGSIIPYEPGDLVEGGEYTVELADNHDTQIATRVVETITYTKPIASGNTTAATKEFDGYIKSVKESNKATSERATITVVVKVAGEITVTDGT